MSDPDCLDYVSFGLVSTVLIAADRLHWETFLPPTVKAGAMQLVTLFCKVCQMSNSAHTVV